MKVYKKKFAHRNILLFLSLSLVYLFIVFAFSIGGSFFSRTNILAFFLHYLGIILVYPVVFYSVLYFKKYAKYLVVIYLILIVGSSFIMLSASFNKLVLALNFAYTLFSFYFYITWEIERNDAGYNPLFSSIDLEKQSRFSIKGIVYSHDRSKYQNVFLTNIDDKSCFVLLETGSFSDKNAMLEITFDGVVFCSKVKIISKYDQGVGFTFLESENATWSLSELCKICRQRGYFLVS